MSKTMSEAYERKPIKMRILIVAFFCLALSACGFQAGALPLSQNALFAEQEHFINIPVLINGTFEPTLEKELTRSFRETFLRQGWFVGEKNDPLTLAGRITGFSSRPTSLNLLGGATQYQITLSVEVKVLEARTQTPRFKQTIKGFADYIVQSETSKDRQSKNRAIREAGRKIAEKVSALLQLAIQSEKEKMPQ